ncbi:unnamed protein product [Linum trigynum]|uniref:Late embryogenesis abundant protein LEA-2 subgroup domain-containing protein n=1 Tax=Linum trigynum TaxID=586398 RepID=A0AAV2C6M7_9ROSI
MRKVFSYLFALLAVLVIISIVGVVLFVAFRSSPPSPPQFSVIAVDVYRMSFVSDPFQQSNLHFDAFFRVGLLARNPNKWKAISYDSPVHVYATFGGQNITGEGFIHQFHQPADDSNVLVASLAGFNMTATMAPQEQLWTDLVAGRVELELECDTILKGKSFHVDCPVVLQYIPETQAWSMQNTAQHGICG